MAFFLDIFKKNSLTEISTKSYWLVLTSKSFQNFAVISYLCQVTNRSETFRRRIEILIGQKKKKVKEELVV